MSMKEQLLKADLERYIKKRKELQVGVKKAKDRIILNEMRIRELKKRLK